jgi:hypothetical protein
VGGPCGASRNDGTLGPLVLPIGSHPACGAGYYCDSTSKCQAQLGPLGTCTRNDECTAPHRCAGAGQCTPTATEDDALGAQNIPCKSTVDCQLGLWCDHTNPDGGPPQSQGVCKSAETSPNPCKQAEVGECSGVCSTTINQCVGFCGAT